MTKSQGKGAFPDEWDEKSTVIRVIKETSKTSSPAWQRGESWGAMTLLGFTEWCRWAPGRNGVKGKERCGVHD